MKKMILAVLLASTAAVSCTSSAPSHNTNYICKEQSSGNLFQYEFNGTEVVLTATIGSTVFDPETYKVTHVTTLQDGTIELAFEGTRTGSGTAGEYSAKMYEKLSFTAGKLEWAEQTSATIYTNSGETWVTTAAETAYSDFSCAVLK